MAKSDSITIIADIIADWDRGGALSPQDIAGQIIGALETMELVICAMPDRRGANHD